MKVVYWWDKYDRLWIIQALNENGDEIACEYAPNRRTLDIVLKLFAEENGIETIERI